MASTDSPSGNGGKGYGKAKPPAKPPTPANVVSRGIDLGTLNRELSWGTTVRKVVSGGNKTANAQALLRGYLVRKGFYVENNVKHKAGSIGPQTFIPLNKDDLHDVKLEWHVNGGYRTLDDDEEFRAAFHAVGAKDMSRAKFERAQGWKQKQLLGELAKATPDEFKFPHAEVSAVGNLEEVDWDSVVAVERSGAGTEGVVFAELPGNLAVVVKAPAKVAAEMFGTLICRKLNINCPCARMVKADSEEGRLMFKKLTQADRKRPALARCVGQMLAGKPGFLVYEYLKAYELADIGVTDGHPAEWAERVLGLPQEMSGQGKTALQNLGALIAFDMMVNNSDRLPCVWMNQGNPGNVMFQRSGDAVISIDNMMTCLKEPLDPLGRALYSEYMERIRSSVEAVALNPSEETPDFARVRSMLREGCDGHGWPGVGVDIGRAGTIEVQNGFLDTISAIVYGNDSTDKAITRKWLEDTATDLFGALESSDASSNTETYGFESIHIDFICEVIDIYREALEKAKEASGKKASEELPPRLKVSMKSRLHRQGSDVFTSDSDVIKAAQKVAYIGCESLLDNQTIVASLESLFRKLISTGHEVYVGSSNTKLEASGALVQDMSTAEANMFTLVLVAPGGSDVEEKTKRFAGHTRYVTLPNTENTDGGCPDWFRFVPATAEFGLYNMEVDTVVDALLRIMAEVGIAFDASHSSAEGFISKLREELKARKQKEDLQEKINERLRAMLRKARRTIADMSTTYNIDVLLSANRENWPEDVASDPSRREKWLSHEDFKVVFKMDAAAYGAIPIWRRHELKKKAGLF